MYALLRAIAGIALRWYYSDIQIDGAERIPRDRPLLLTVNHPNALVDALLVGWIVPRRVLITAKSTIFVNPLVGALLRWLGVVPLRRAKDEPTAGTATLDASRNAQTFADVRRALAGGGCVLIFPEGVTPNEPSLAPLKTGAARMALDAAANVTRLAILPIGLVFERKEAPRSRVLVTIGEAILVTERLSEHAAESESVRVATLTSEIGAALRSLTLSYPTLDEASRSVRFARTVASLIEDAPAIGVVDRGFGVETTIARRIEAMTSELATADASTRARADALVARIESLRARAAERHIALEDVQIDLAMTPGARFVAREGWRAVVAGPVAAWGWLNHWLPLRAARLMAMRNVESAADPAMRTIVAGAAFVTLAYLAQTMIVGLAFGWMAATGYLVSLPLAADVNFAFSDRLRRARRRARAYLLFRREPALQAELRAEMLALREEVFALDRALSANGPAPNQ